jgi:DNA repair exonuclease SbcCD ATPase subunit
MRNAALNELINMFKYEISTIEKKLHDSEVIVNKINDTKQTLESLQASEKVVKLLVKELSPTEGLIAKSINSFLNLFIDDINSVIDTVWTYSLKLQPCSVGVDNDLDYRFPVKINDNEEIDDISKGSSGLKEIIDLAFKVVFIKYLGLEDFPLYLDEYAITMDYTHRINAYSAIDKVLSPNFSQVFIISHFESIYGSMRNCDISIINPDNLMIDSNLEYNKVMKLQ